MVTCISLVTLHFNLDGTTRTGRETMVYESSGGEAYIIREIYGLYTSPRLVRLVKQWFTSRTSQLVNCIDIYILMISNSAELIPPVNGWRDKHAKDNTCSSL